MLHYEFDSECEPCHLVVDVGLAWVAPDGQVSKAEHQGMARRHPMQHHVLINEATTQHLGHNTGTR